MMRRKTIAALMLAGLVGATACGGEDAPGGLDPDIEDVGSDEESDAGGEGDSDAGGDDDAGEEDVDPDEECDPTVSECEPEECDADGNNCQSEERGIEFALRPDTTDITRSHIAWLPVEGAAHYEMRVLQNDPDAGGRAVVHREQTEGLHAQVPEAFRDQPDTTVEISAMNADGESLLDDEIKLPLAKDPPDREITCDGTCHANSYGYRLRLWSNISDHGDAVVELTGDSGYYIAYSPGNYANIEDDLEPWQDVYQENLSVGAGDEVIYGPGCEALSGPTYFVQSTAGPWEEYASQQVTTVVQANDGESLCGIYDDFNGLRLLYNGATKQNNVTVSPALTCNAPCPSGGGSGTSGGGTGTGSGWPWGTLDDWNLPREIVADDGTLWTSDGPTRPGWADDIPLAAVLDAITPNIFDINIENEEWVLRGLSIRPVIDPERDSQIDLDLELLQAQGPEYLYPLLDELEGGLYVLTQYYGGTKVYSMALMHENRSER